MSIANAAPANKVNRSVRLVRPPVPGFCRGKIVITQTKGRKVESTTYYVTPFDSDMGRAFQLEKVGSEKAADGSLVVSIVARYSILLAGDESRCDCLGQEKWGHRHPCRHIASLLALGSKLDSPAPVQVCEPAAAC